MSNENTYWENEDDNLENELNGSHNSRGDDGIANLRKAKRADEKRIKELEEQLAKFSQESNERVVREILESKGVNSKATRLVLKDLETISEEAVTNWLAENGDLIGFVPEKEKQVDSADIYALKKQDDATHFADAPTYSDDVARAIANADSEEEIMAIIKNLG